MTRSHYTFIALILFFAWPLVAMAQQQTGATGQTATSGASQAYGPPAGGSQTAGQAAGAGQGFQVSGGSGFASINGAVGSSPQVTLTDATREASSTFRISVPIPIRRAGWPALVIGGEYMDFHFKGEPTYDGIEFTTPDGFGIFDGDQLETCYKMQYIRISADVLFTFPNFSGAGGLRLGPRIQWFKYSDQFRVTNTTSHVTVTTPESEEERDYSMPGIGVAGSFDFGGLLGSGAPSITPRLTGSVCLGHGHGMRYQSAELFLELLLGIGGPGSFLPSLIVQGGVVGFDIVEVFDKEDEEHLHVVQGGQYSDRADYRVSYPMFRAGVAF